MQPDPFVVTVASDDDFAIEISRLLDVLKKEMTLQLVGSRQSITSYGLCLLFVVIPVILLDYPWIGLWTVLGFSFFGPLLFVIARYRVPNKIILDWEQDFILSDLADGQKSIVPNTRGGLLLENRVNFFQWGKFVILDFLSFGLWIYRDFPYGDYVCLAVWCGFCLQAIMVLRTYENIRCWRKVFLPAWKATLISLREEEEKC